MTGKSRTHNHTKTVDLVLKNLPVNLANHIKNMVYNRIAPGKIVVKNEFGTPKFYRVRHRAPSGKYRVDYLGHSKTGQYTTPNEGWRSAYVVPAEASKPKAISQSTFDKVRKRGTLLDLKYENIWHGKPLPSSMYTFRN